MKGCRPLTDNEDQALVCAYASARDRCMHELCSSTGLRIAEACSIRVCDVVKNGEVVKNLYVRRRDTKGKAEGAYFELHPHVRKAIYEQVRWLWDNGYTWPDCYLLKSARGTHRALTRCGARYSLLAAAVRAGVPTIRLGTHSFRKTFARRVEALALEELRSGAALNPYDVLRIALRHRSYESTISYIGGNSEYVLKVIRALPGRAGI